MITRNKPFIICCYIFMGILALSAIIPLLILVSSSFSSEAGLVKYGYSVFPKDFTLATYKYLWTCRKGVLRAYEMSLIVTVTGVTLSLGRCRTGYAVRKNH